MIIKTKLPTGFLKVRNQCEIIYAKNNKDVLCTALCLKKMLQTDIETNNIKNIGRKN